MPAVAEVQFKASGSSEVEGAFKSIGTAAGESTTKIGQNSSAMKSMGQGMKSSVSSIANVATAFATLSLSVVNTWRSYRDLGDAQLGVDRANFKVQKSTQAVANAQKLVQGLKAGMRKTDLESVAASSKIIAREEALKKKLKDGSITRKQAKAEQDAINLARSKVGSDKASELAKAEQDLKNKTEALGLATESAAQKQKHFNDSTQDFYLSLLPTAISTIATAVSGFESIKNVLGGGGGGLIGSLSGIGLVLGAGSLALLAYKNNWLGFRDAVGGAIDWVKERFGVWKDTIAQVFNLIKSGDWGGAFNKIREAAYKFWLDLKKQVPLLTAVDTIVNAIKNGNWKYAFSTIVAAADVMWLELKKKVPFLADVEKFITDIAGGNWKAIPEAILSAFNATLGKGIEWIFGKNWKAGLDAKIAEIQAEAAVNKRSIPVQVALTVNEAIKDTFGVDIIKWFTDHPITSKIPFFGGITMMVDDPKFRGAVAEGSLLIVKALGEALGRVAGLMDPYVADFLTAMFDPATWTTAADAITKAGAGILKAIGGAISTAAADPNLTAAAMGDAAAGIWQAISDWFTTKMPETTAVIQGIVAKLKLGIETAKVDLQNLGISIWNQIVEGIRAFTGGAASPFGGALDALKKNPIELPVTPVVNEAGKTAIQAWTTQNPIQLKTGLNTTGATKDAGVFKNKVERQSYIAQLKATTKQADQSLKQFVNKANNTTATIKIRAVTTGPFRNLGLADWGMHQHGYQSTVHRPTAFIAGEGGRPEDVTVRPRGSAQRGGSGGGGFNGIVNVYVDGVLRPARYDMGVRK